VRGARRAAAGLSAAGDWDRVETDVAGPPGRAVSTTSQELDLADLRPNNSGIIDSAADGAVRIVTPPMAFAYGATLPLPARPTGAGSGAVRIRAALKGGAVGVGILTADGKAFVDRNVITSLAKTVEVFLNIPRLSLAGDLVVQTWERATSGTVRLESGTLIVRDRVGSLAEGSTVR
jgi:hypothetical protein